MSPDEPRRFVSELTKFVPITLIWIIIPVLTDTFPDRSNYFPVINLREITGKLL